MELFNECPSLTTLPAELLSKIYSYIFCDSFVRLRNQDDPRPHSEPSRNAVPVSLQLVSKFFYNDQNLRREFCKNVTISISSHADLQRLQSRLDPSLLRLVQHICISAEWQSPKSQRLHRVPYRGCFRGMQKGQDWVSVNVPLLMSLCPNIQSLSTTWVGVYINHFRFHYPFTVRDLIRAAKAVAQKPTRKPDASIPHHKYTIQSDRNPNYRKPESENLATLSQLDSSQPPVDGETLSPTAILSDFSRDLVTALNRTSESYGPNWYRTLVNDAVKNDIEMIFHMELLFEDETNRDDVTIFHDVAVSSRDWMSRLRVDGVEYEFRQDVTGFIDQVVE